jgi:phage gpG-like protein
MLYPLNISLSTEGARQLEGEIGRMVARIRDLSPVWPEAYEMWRGHERTLFATQGRSAGLLWPGLSARYAAWKARFFPGKTLLRRSDRLYASLTAPYHSDQVYRPGLRSLEVGTQVPYAAHLESGKGRWWQRPRERPVVVMSKAALQELAGQVHAYLWAQRASGA